jgi:GNAT superfamily N-acetyltransferase
MLELRDLTHEDLHEIRHWFDDSDTRDGVGDLQWANGLVRLARSRPETRFGWLATEAGQPVGLADVELDGRTAHVALVVCPQRRGQGIGRQLALLVAGQPQLKDCTFEAFIHTNNRPSRRLARSFGMSETPLDQHPEFLRLQLGGTAKAVR